MSDDLLHEFIFDAREHLVTAGCQLLELEKNPGRLESLNALMGTLHTLKGNSGFLDIKDLYNLTHHAESLLQTSREKKADCPQPVIDLLLQVLDTAEAILNFLEDKDNGEVDWLEALTQALSEAESRLEGGGETFAAEEEEDNEEIFAEALSTAPPESALDFSLTPEGTALVTLADGDLDREGDYFPARVEALFQSGGGGLVVDLKNLTSLTGRELKLIWAASRKNPRRTAFLVDPAEQPDLYRLFRILDLDKRLSLFPDQEPALASLNSA